MKRSILIFNLVIIGFFCFGQSGKSSSDSTRRGPDSTYRGTDSVYRGNSDSTKNVQSQKPFTKHTGTDSVYRGNSDSTKNVQSQKPFTKHTGTDSVYRGTDSAYTRNPDSSKNIQSQKPSTTRSKNNFYTTYEYTESNGDRLIIQNSFPKSGIHYTDPRGKKYIYAVFWTKIINETADPLELTIDFPLDSFEIPSASRYMRLLLSSDTMTIDKEPLYDYGMTIKSFLDNNLHKSPSLKKRIQPNNSGSFYVVTLSTRGVNGTLRTGLSLKEQNLFYTVNDKEIQCGKINLKNLRPSK